jgi:iron(III) transport system ATP-binding protein
MTNAFPSPDSTKIAKGRVGPVFAGNITFEHVGYFVAGKHILHDVSLTIRAGRVACLLGPSGCGKTTLLKLAAGVIAPTTGRILLDGVEVAGPNRFVQPEKRNVGLMFQDFALFPHLTALENVAYGLYALKRSDALRIAELALQRVGLGAMAQLYPAALSGGEQQRVALARAIVPRPQVILMDEPFSGLDQRMRDSIRDDTLGVVRETQATTLLVTHDPTEALAFSDDIFVMRAGYKAVPPPKFCNIPLTVPWPTC